MASNIGMIVVGIVFIIIGVLNCMGNISTLHSYHRKRVSEEDRIPFGRMVGLGMLIIGGAIILNGVLALVAEWIQKPVCSIVGTVILIVGLVVGLVLQFYAMHKYNKGIF